MKFKNMGRSLLALLLFLAGIHSATAQFTVTGKVTDATGDGLAGATIAVVGATIGTTADLDGNYRLEVPGTAATLAFTYTGYKTVNMEVTSANPMANVIMEEDYAGLDEVVISPPT